ncbi:MAG: spermidine synthase [Roseiarcus sp.]
MRLRSPDWRPVALYGAAFSTGAIVMSFEMLGSRYLNPYFGSGIYTWAALISTVLAALAAGYFCGGWLADRRPQIRILGLTVVIGSLYLVLLPSFADFVLDAVLGSVADIRLGSMISAFAIMFFPVVFLGMYSPFAIRLRLGSAQQSGSVSGAVYGVSTLGSITGTWGTTFVLMPEFGSRAITIGMGVVGVLTGLALMVAPFVARKSAPASSLAVAVVAAGLLVVCADNSYADDLLDLQARADALEQKDGLIAHIETEYNDVFLVKKDARLAMSFQRHQQQYTESVGNLGDPDELSVAYTQTMMVGAIYPDSLRKALMIGLGAGSMPTYLARFVPELVIDTVELDPGVIAAAKTYFGVRETPRTHVIENDGRVFLVRNHDIYDLILIDAFRGGYVPFHLLTKEFYTLLKQHLSPTGVAVFNVHADTKLYESTLLTLKAVFPTVDLYYRSGSLIPVAGAAAPLSRETLAQRAAALQARYRFRYPMPDLLAARVDWPNDLEGELLTDDFSPVSLYDAIKSNNKRQW